MSGSATSKGGVRFEYRPDVAADKFRWRAAMRNHSGYGPTLEAAVDDLVAEITAELATAKGAKATLPKGHYPKATDK